MKMGFLVAQTKPFEVKTAIPEWRCIRIVFFFWLTACLINPVAARAADMTPYVESLGIPFSKQYPGGDAIYARNVWDLQAFEGRLYIGAGNWDNRGPAPNAGPVPIMAWVPQRARYVREGTADEEEIERFEVIGGRLYIPGTDPRQGWDLGNLYRREADGRWKKLRTIPRAIHTFALTGYEGRLYAGLGATNTVPWYTDFRGYGSAIAVSEDDGASWRFLPLGGYRIHAFLHVRIRLYGVDVLPGPGLARWLANHGRNAFYAPVYALDPSRGSFKRRPDLNAARLFPDTEEVRGHASVIDRVLTFGYSALYTGVGYKGPFGLYRADSLMKGSVSVHRIRLPDGARPWDLLERQGTAFVLLSKPAVNPGVQIQVLASRDLTKWREVLHFTAPTFARSFELLNGDFYFGLGCKVQMVSRKRWKPMNAATGEILRISGEHWKLPDAGYQHSAISGQQNSKITTN